VVGRAAFAFARDVLAAIDMLLVHGVIRPVLRRLPRLSRPY
jgi:hypothetical protein